MSAVFTGCEDPGKETETELTVSTTSMLFDANNTAAQTFTVNATAAWTVATEANWIHVDPTTGEAGKDIVVTVTVDEPATGAESRTDYVTVKCESKTKQVVVTQNGSTTLPEWVPDISGAHTMVFEDPYNMYKDKTLGENGDSLWGTYPAQITVDGYSAFISINDGKGVEYELTFMKADTTYYLFTDKTARAQVEYKNEICPYYQSAFLIQVAEEPKDSIIFKKDLDGKIIIYSYDTLASVIREGGVLAWDYYLYADNGRGQTEYFVPAFGSFFEYQQKDLIADVFILPRFVPQASGSPAKKASIPSNMGAIKGMKFAPKEMLKNATIQKISKRK